ncbi:unnamed protein product [Diatraea saccharalis]|uniref:Uncharacterized protein n=1 Tax=Diatraea saccharalis TaxID=40085 RepID=A0A9N9WKA1_9NEOP|nr:unnamed protein product [Diatraea saccharalis]
MDMLYDSSDELLHNFQGVVSVDSAEEEEWNENTPRDATDMVDTDDPNEEQDENSQEKEKENNVDESNPGETNEDGEDTPTNGDKPAEDDDANDTAELSGFYWNPTLADPRWRGRSVWNYHIVVRRWGVDTFVTGPAAITAIRHLDIIAGDPRPETIASIRNY